MPLRSLTEPLSIEMEVNQVMFKLNRGLSGLRRSSGTQATYPQISPTATEKMEALPFYPKA